MGGTQRLSEHHDRVDNVADVLDEIRRKALDLENGEVADRVLLEADRLRERKFRLVVIGEFSRGKSTLINALLGEALLPAKLRPTTTTIIEISHGAQLELRVQEHDGSEREISPGELKDAVSVGGDSCVRSRLVTIQHPSPLLAQGLVIVDTPGVNDLASLRQDITLGHLPAADAVMFVLDAKACFTESERLFLARDVLRSSVKRVLFVVNKADQLHPPYDPTQIDTLEARVRELAGAFTEVTRVHPVAAKAALRAKLDGNQEVLEQSRLPELEAALARFLVEETGALVLGRALHQGLNAVKVLKQGLGIRRDLLSEEHGVAIARVGELRQRTTEARQELRSRRETWNAHCDEVIGRARSRAHANLQRIQAEVSRVRLAPGEPQAVALQRDLSNAVASVAEQARTEMEAELGALASELHGSVATLPVPLQRERQRSFALERVEPLTEFVTPASAVAAAGAMGLAALFTSLVPGGILLVGAAAFFVARSAEAQAEAPGLAAQEQVLADLTEASRRLDNALAGHGMELSALAWNEVAGETMEQLSSNEIALRQAERDLDEKNEARLERAGELASQEQGLVVLESKLLSANVGTGNVGTKEHG